MTTLPRPYTVRTGGRGIFGLPLYVVDKEDEVMFVSYDKAKCQDWAIVANNAYLEGWLAGRYDLPIGFEVG